MKALKEVRFNFKGQNSYYKGKVRDVYSINDDLLIMIVSDRISAFDVVLPRAIPFKGQVLNQLASNFLDETADIVPNWKIATPDPNVTVGYKCDPFKVEMVIRGYLTGHAWREYRAGRRKICGVSMPEGMVENQKFEAQHTEDQLDFAYVDNSISKINNVSDQKRPPFPINRKKKIQKTKNRVGTALDRWATGSHKRRS